ncbi:Transcription initiation factor TFIIIB Brf1 subunit [Volvox africanus]|uniref:Transcription initiation factor TFIIIB Brf1 subunit n=1 Tax=Volvox africanus TaxID=51714 RepID=A0ABQ5RZM0_9CHLO|nr:Transcription initiation factor TFIIIB Brf1 subunit [Volvox africanus]
MVWCSQCQADVEVEADDAKGFSCCMQCGRVVEDTAFSSDVMFAKGSDGTGELVGQMVGANGDAHGIGRYSGGRLWASGGGHEAAVSRGRQEVVALVEALRISPSSEAIDAAHRLYRLALQRGFTKGRRVNQVAAVCLYIFCRLERRPYMLIDFSDHLSVNVYELGAVFLNMLRLLRLDEHATFTKPIDPSLFMNRFVDRLRLPTQELRTKIGNTATRLVQSMKRDWMLTGRRPNGICGAALFLAAHIHGVEKTKRDIISIVHVGWGTVERRVLELAETGGADLTLKEIEERDKAAELEREKLLLEYERAASEKAREGGGSGQPQLPWPSGGDGSAEGVEEGDGGSEVVPRGALESGAMSRVCEHVRTGSLLVAHGMCRQCLEEYLQVTMAVQEGAQDPPAYVRNLRRDVRKRVRAQLESERPLLLLQGGGVARGPGEEEEEDVHQARHRENEAAAEEGASPNAPTAGPSSGLVLAVAIARTAPVEESGGSRISAAEEADFDEALRSSDLQPLARALGGVVAAVATAPLLQRSELDLRDAATEEGQRNVMPRVEGGAGAFVERAAPGGPAAGTQPGAGASHDAGDVQALRALALDAELAGREEDLLSSDHLSDVDDDEIAGYLSTREEASVREQLWVEMNKDWIEKQQAKKAAEAEASQAGLERPKRKYTRKKAELPAADDAAGATRNLLESKKLSNKINYGALADLFDSPGPTGNAGDALGTGAAGTPTGVVSGGGSAFHDDAGPYAVDGFDGLGGAATQAEQPGGQGGGRAGPEEDKYMSALEEEQSRLGGLGGGGFLGSLTFMRGAGEVKGAGGRARPQGLSLKPRGR